MHHNVLTCCMDKYTRWYTQITKRAQGRKLEPPYERHHIRPRSLRGTDDQSHIAVLTPREHFICHWLLIKMTVGKERYKMLNALRMMRAENPGQKRYKTKITARVYEKIKTEYALIQSERFSGKNNPMYGDKFYRSAAGKQRQREAVAGENNGAKKEEARRKIAESKLGKLRAPFSEEWIDNLKSAHKGSRNGMFGKKHSVETKSKQREKAIGRTQSAETKQKKADAIRGLKREKKLCPHCAQLIAVNTYPRWHGDRCKLNQPAQLTRH
jgi:ribosomal protein S27AE